MSEDVWSAQSTTPDAVEAALRTMLRERHAADGRLAPARVLNLVVVVDRELKGEVANRLARVGRYNASRTIVCSIDGGQDTLDARAVMTYEEGPPHGAAASLTPMHEQVELDVDASRVPELGAIVDAVLVSELPTVLWCPHGHLEAVSSLHRLADVILLDSDDDPDPPAALAKASQLGRDAYVVDLAWLRTTPWRERIATTFDPTYRRCELGRICRVEIRHRSISAASALLLAGWLTSRLGWRAAALEATGGGGLRGYAERDGSSVAIELAPVPQDVPGLAGVTIKGGGTFELSLDRGPGGLTIRRRRSDGSETDWQVLGASRGEGGILGEGVRQALLRDPTYPPALAAARGYCGA